VKVGNRQPRSAPAAPAAAAPLTSANAEAAPCDEASTVADDSEPGCTVPESLHNLVQLLPRVMRGLRRASREPVADDEVPLGPRHSSALALLRGKETTTTVGALASALDLNLATVSGLVADLERAGFAERSTDPADRRRTIVRITPHSEQLVDLWLEGSTAPIARALQHLSPVERNIFVKAMGYLDAELNGV
jgi:DNA-binding MarR family transcriptional regulator